MIIKLQKRRKKDKYINIINQQATVFCYTPTFIAKLEYLNQVAKKF